jgi:hypothetical protein
MRLLAAFLAASALATVAPVRPETARVSLHNRLLLNRAAVEGRARLDVMMIVAPTAMDRVAAAIAHRHGRIVRRDPRVGYLRADLAIETVVALASKPGVEAWQIGSGSAGAWYRDARPESNASMLRGFETLAPPRPSSPAKAESLPPLPADVARTDGATGAEDVGLNDWRRRHPDFDGRGVTIAIVESALADLSHPAVGDARTLDGRTIPKLAGILNAIDPHRFDETRVALDTVVRATTSWTRVGARTYVMPGPGLYRFGRFDLPSGANLLQRFGILENIRSGDILVDTDGDADFRDEQPIADVNQRLDVRTLSLQPSGTLPFVMARGLLPHHVHLYPATSGHQTMTLSVAAGSESPRNLAPGVAPGARILLVRGSPQSESLVDYIEAYLAAAQRTDVDLITDSAGVSPLPDLSAEFLGRFFTRLRAAYGKVMFRAANNTQLFLASAANAGGALSVGGSIGPATFGLLYGGTLEGVQVHPTGAAGPGADGTIRPDVLAPMHVIGADLTAVDRDVAVPRGAPRWRLPAGYEISCCTSASSPYAAGLAALLVSGARQSALTYTPEALEHAIRVGARFLSNAPAHQQGNGVFDVNAAWSELHQHVDHRITSMGLFEREGWHAGMSARRTLTVVRESGPLAPAGYRTSWLGNDGTFSGPSSVVLARGTRAALPIDVTVTTPGVHSAILNLHDPSTGRIVFRTQATIVAARAFDPHGHTLRVAGSLQSMRQEDHYFTVPEDVHALTFRLHVRRGTLRATILPWTGVYPSYYLHRHPAAGRQFQPGVHTIALSRPHAGVWAIALTNDAARRQPGGSSGVADYVVDIGLRGAAIDAQPADSRRLAITIARSRSAVTKPALTVAHASVTARQHSIRPDGLPALFPLDVPAGTGVLRVTASSGRPRDLELHLYNCSSGECFSHEFTFEAAPTPSISVRRPPAGRWVAAVSSRHLSSTAVDVALESMMTVGSSTALDVPAQPERGTAWTVTVEPRTRALFFELFDRAMEQDEAEHPWENRPGVTPLADRPVPLGTLLYRFE